MENVSLIKKKISSLQYFPKKVALRYFNLIKTFNILKTFIKSFLNLYKIEKKKIIYINKLPLLIVI